ncbi:MAG: 4Fe-4S dicluster domain-containing protein, partial [Planctomycetales bacterium]|nr:4Fe-4S dicluster domain-containing protein [Planctomycetales bacterium]
MNTRDLQMFPEGGGWLLVEFGAETREEARQQAAGMIRELEGKEHVTGSKLFSDSAEETRIWEIRESGLGATARVPTEPDTWPGWEDSAVAPEHLGDYLREMRTLLNRYEYDGAFYGHFGQGCLHTRITFDLKTRAGIEKYRRFVGEAADLVLRYDGSYSGEHGDGQSRAELLPKMYGPELCEAFREFKSIWDPDNRMNPGKVVAPYPITSNLRLGADFRPAHPTTHFQFPDDEYSFSRASLRCVGVGKCRREDGGTMCPSYMVTRDEKHSTRGRAHLLFEMLQGDVISDGWRDEAVKESLDLCLACKGCKGDCPINVDLATYKAEFLSHYYAGRLRPVTAYSMGLIYWWARLASIAPRFVNTLMDTPVISSIPKRLGGIAAEREIPAFAVTSFRERFRQRKPRNVRGQTVILWPDTFNNFFHPETAEAAVEVLEAGGFHVKLPDSMLCCGRPLYDFGMLHLAKRQLRQIMDALRTEIEAGTCIVGLEPSCVATFRDELGNLFPRDEVASKLKRQTFLFSEFVHQHADKFDFPHLERRALVHGHCHHKSILGMEAEEKLFEQLGIEYDVVDSGCCGMAGSFGFEREKYDVSIACGERALLPAVREA